MNNDFKRWEISKAYSMNSLTLKKYPWQHKTKYRLFKYNKGILSTGSLYDINQERIFNKGYENTCDMCGIEMKPWDRGPYLLCKRCESILDNKIGVKKDIPVWIKLRRNITDVKADKIFFKNIISFKFKLKIIFKDLFKNFI